MTDEELARTIKEISESIANLPKSDKPLPKEEKKRRTVLLMKRKALLNIKSAREKKQQNDEFLNNAVYSLLNSWGGKYPFLVHILMMKLKQRDTWHMM